VILNYFRGFLWGYVKDIVYKTPVTSLGELKVRNVAAIERVTQQILENIRREIEYRYRSIDSKNNETF
jgi:hypothetical protein